MVKKKDVKCFTKEGKDGNYTTCVDKKTGNQLRKGKPKAKPKLKVVDKLPSKAKAKDKEKKFEEYFARHTDDWDKHYNKALKSSVGKTKKIKEEKAEIIAFDKLRAEHKASMKPKKKKLLLVPPKPVPAPKPKAVERSYLGHVGHKNSDKMDAWWLKNENKPKWKKLYKNAIDDAFRKMGKKADKDGDFAYTLADYQKASVVADEKMREIIKKQIKEFQPK